MIVFPKLGKPVHQEAFTTKMLGLPKYNGGFDFSKKKLDVPTLFPIKKSSIDLRIISYASLLERIDNSTIIYSTNRYLFFVTGRDRYEFRILEPCIRLVTGDGKAYILTEKHMYVYGERKVKIFELKAIDLSVSPFNEVFILTADNILIFDENGIKEAFPYKGNVKFIHFYLFRELILTDDHQVFHLNLNKLEVSVIYVTQVRIVSTIFKDMLYIMEKTRFTLLNIEEKRGETIHIGRPMRIAVGDSMAAIYSLDGSFLFCDRLSLINNEGIIYDVAGLLGFFFVGDRSYFLFKDRFVMWNKGDVKVIDVLCKKEIKDYIVSFPETLDMLEEEYKNRRTATAVFKPNGVYNNLTGIIKSLFKKEDASTSSSTKKRIKYMENKRGGF